MDRENVQLLQLGGLAFTGLFLLCAALLAVWDTYNAYLVLCGVAFCFTGAAVIAFHAWQDRPRPWRLGLAIGIGAIACAMWYLAFEGSPQFKEGRGIADKLHGRTTSTK